MEQPNFTTKQDFPTEVRKPSYIPKGFSLLSENPLNCSNCGQNLAVVLVVKDIDYEHKFRADCDKCGDHSFIKTIKGKTFIGPAQGKKLVSCDTNDNLTIIRVEKD